MNDLLAKATAHDPLPWIARDGDIYREDADGLYVEMIEYGDFYEPAQAEFLVWMANNAERLLEIEAACRERWPECPDANDVPELSRLGKALSVPPVGYGQD